MSRPSVYTPPYRPRFNQQEALDKMEGMEAFALFMAMRTGKTKVTLDDFGRLELAGMVDDLLVFAPGGCYETWKEAAEEHFSVDLLSRVRIYVWRSGQNSAKAKKELKTFMDWRDGPRMLIMNIEATSSVKEAREVAVAFAKARKSMGAVDESVTIGNEKSKRTKFIIDQVGAWFDYRRILSGLPTPRDPLSLFSQFRFLDWKILNFKSFFAFRGRYAILWPASFGGRTVQVVKGFRDLDDLNKRIEPNTYRCRLEDCYDLPEKDYSMRYVELHPEQKRLYAEMKEFSTAKLGEMEHVTATVVIAQMIRLHQILCGHTTDEAGVHHEIPSYRMDYLMELLADYDGKAIIWCAYDPDVTRVTEALRKEYGPQSVARFWGGNKATREDEEKAFKAEPDRRFMVATASAGGRGREWSLADLTVYYSQVNNLDFRSQSEERTQAVGKTRQASYVDLVAKGTVDEKIIYALRNKIDLSTAVLGDGYQKWLI